MKFEEIDKYKSYLKENKPAKFDTYIICREMAKVSVNKVIDEYIEIMNEHKMPFKLFLFFISEISDHFSDALNSQLRCLKEPYKKDFLRRLEEYHKGKLLRDAFNFEDTDKADLL